MRSVLVAAVVVVTCCPRGAVAQSAQPRGYVAAIGGDVGFLAPDNGDGEEPRALEVTTATTDAFAEYYYTDRVSLRGMFGWARPAFESMPTRWLRRQHLNLNVVYNWKLAGLRPFVTVGGGAYFLSSGERGDGKSTEVTKPGGNLGWGLEYHLRTFALKSEMNVQILNDERNLPELKGHTLTAFTWTFGLKVPF